MSKSQTESRQQSATKRANESANESQATLRFDSEQIRASMPRPGLVLRERYRLESEIGRGAMGVVFRATDLELLRPVAVKILAEKLGGTGEVGKRERGEDAGGAPAVPGVLAEPREAGEEGKGKEERGEDAGGAPAVPRAPAVPGAPAVQAVPAVRAVPADDMRSRFLREARAAAALNHPHIVAVYDVGEDHGFPFFVMELVDGPNLGQAPPHDLQQIVEFACQICAALEHAHANNIVHRDLKPANVLLSGVPARSANAGSADLRSEISNSKAQGSNLKSQSSDFKGATAKLADLGLALPARGSRISRAGTIVGTAAYMSPEQALGITVDGRADLYALGVVLYELTTGRVPFLGDNPLATISQHLHAPVVPPRVVRPDLPRAIETIILRLLAKDPDQRYATANETANALRAALDGQAEAAEEEGASAVAILDALSRGRLVGRTEELAEARELWRRAQEGRGHCLLFSGEPGAGKTRLAREVIVQATLDGAVVFSGACYENEAATPYLQIGRAHV